MVKKKSVKKTKKKRPIKKSAKSRIAKKTTKSKNLKFSTKRKIDLVFKNLISFVILFIISFIFYTLSKGGVYEDLFFLISFILGAIAILFLIILLAFLFMKGMRK